MKKTLLRLVSTMAFTLALTAGTAFAQTTIIDQNFDQFTEGTEENPATTDISGNTGKLYKTIQWNGKSVYEAGGKLLVADGGKLTSARLSSLAYGDVIKVTFDVKVPDGSGICQLKLGYLTNVQFPITDTNWHTFSTVITGAGRSNSLEFSPYLSASGILIDNVKVEKGDFLPAPQANQPTKATRTSFTASWKRVSGAEAYLLSVYSYNNGEKDYFLEDKEVTATTASVDGLDATKTYYFTVKAKKGETVSDPSEEIEVVPVIEKLTAPEASAPTDVNGDGFTANWKAAADATGYEVTVGKTVTLAADQQGVTILSENFDKSTEGEYGVPEYGIFRGYLDSYTTLPGWYAVNPAFAKGSVGLSPYSGEGYILTPAIDLSHSAAKVNVTLGEYSYAGFEAGAKVLFTLYNGQDSITSKEVTLESGMKAYDIELEGGSAESYVRILYSGDKKLYIDSIAINQNMKAGDSYSQIISNADAGNALSFAVKAPKAEGTAYFYSVKAYARTIVDGEIGYIYSEASNTVNVQNTTVGIDAAPAESQAKEAYRTDISGRRLAAPQRGINIVVYTDGTVKKLIVD